MIIPIFNENENISPLYEELKVVLDETGAEYEVIFVDDGSDDGSSEILHRLAQGDERLHIIQFRKNFGQTAAIVAGVEHAQGEIIVTLDGDGQNDPRDIPRLLRKLEEGYDVVSGWRKNRKEHDKGGNEKGYHHQLIEEIQPAIPSEAQKEEYGNEDKSCIVCERHDADKGVKDSGSNTDHAGQNGNTLGHGSEQKNPQSPPPGSRHSHISPDEGFTCCSGITGATFKGMILEQMRHGNKP